MGILRKLAGLNDTDEKILEADKVKSGTTNKKVENNKRSRSYKKNFPAFFKKYHYFNDLENKNDSELLKLLLLPKKKFPESYDIVKKEFARRGRDLEEILKAERLKQGGIRCIFKKVKDAAESTYSGDLLLSDKAFYYYPIVIYRRYELALGPLIAMNHGLATAGTGLMMAESAPFGFIKGFINIELGIEPKEMELKSNYDPKKDLLPLSLICQHIPRSFILKLPEVIKISIWKNGRVMFWTREENNIKNIIIKKDDIANFKKLAEEIGFIIEDVQSNSKFRADYKKEYRK